MEPANIDPNNNIVRNWLAGIAIGLVIVVGITFALHRNDNISPAADIADMSTTTEASATSTSQAAAPAAGTFAALPGTVTTAAMGETLSVADQPAGSSASIGSMTLFKRSWVAIRDMQGTILGAGLFPADATSGSVALLRATTAGERYEAIVYVDDGDKVFDLRKDMLVTNPDGSAVSAVFSVQ